MNKVIYFFCLIIFLPQAFAGPFGLNKGMSLSELQKFGRFTPSNTPSWYESKTIKNGHDAFESYQVLVSPTVGLCKIVATGKDINSSSFGEQILDAFKSLEEPITSKYGQPSDQFNFLKSGSIWKDPEDWMMSLYKKERILRSFWATKPLPDSLQVISLSAGALSNSKGWISLGYEFDNSDECIDESKKAKNSNL